MARITYVKKSRKVNECGRCGDTIPVGSPYKHWEFNFPSVSHTRCMKPECAPKPSDLARSEYLGWLGDLQSSSPFTGTTKDELETEVDDIKSQLEEKRDEQEEKRNNMPEQLQESDSGNTLQERYDSLDSAISELESVDIEDFDEEAAKETYQEEHPDATEEQITEEMDRLRKEHFDNIRNDLDSALSNIS